MSNNHNLRGVVGPLFFVALATLASVGDTQWRLPAIIFNGLMAIVFAVRLNRGSSDDN